VLQSLGWSARDAVGFVLCGAAVIAILVNVLFLQTGSHPAPFFKGGPAPAAKPASAPASKSTPAATSAAVPAPTPEVATATVPRPRPPELAAGKAPARPAEAAPAKAASPSTPRPPGEIIIDIQRELARRGFYDGTVDGLYGPRTDGAIRDFEQAAGLKASHEPSETLLASITRAPAKVTKTSAIPVAAAAPPGRPPGALPDRPTPSRRVLAVQRALADYGYGQLKPTGIVDAETQAAIEKFERERRLPITGQPSDRVARELAALTGRPLE
jgi:peptidoglycan hydrolase-like protein with peptidoglycan-binding domain